MNMFRMTDEGEEGMVRHMCPMWDNFAYLHCKERRVMMKGGEWERELW
jgi:hypothetical protein